MASFIENVNTVANATVLATGDLIEDAQIARDEAVAAAIKAESAATSSDNYSEEAKEWATKAYNNPVEGTEFSSYHWSVVSKENSADEVVNDSIISNVTAWSSNRISELYGNKSDSDHLHTGVYEPSFSKGTAFNSNFPAYSDNSGTSNTVGRSDHSHGDIYETKRVSEGTAYNKNFGVVSGSVSEGDHDHDSSYMKTTGYIDGTSGKILPTKIPFVVDVNNPSSTEVSAGNHIHAATTISYTPTGGSVTSGYVQGAIEQLEGAVDTATVSEKTKITGGMTDASYSVSNAGANIGNLIGCGMTVGLSSKNAQFTGGTGVQINYSEEPSKLIEGNYDVTVSVVMEANTTYALGLAINGVAVDTAIKSMTGSDTSATTGAFSLSLPLWVSDLNNTDIVQPMVYSSGTNNIEINSLTVSWAGQPEGALVLSGVSVSHSETTGRDVLNQHPLTSIYEAGSGTALDVLLSFKTDNASGHTDGNIAALDINGNLIDSGYAPSDISDKMLRITDGTIELGNIVTMSSGGDSINSETKVTDLALVNGDSAKLFNVLAGSSDNNAATFSQLSSVENIANGKIAKVASPTVGNFPQLDTNGELVNSSYNELSFAAVSHLHSFANISENGDGANLLQDVLDDKYDIVVNQPTDNLVVFETGGLLKDSGVAYTDIPAKTSINSDISGITAIRITNEVVMSETDYEALVAGAGTDPTTMYNLYKV